MRNGCIRRRRERKPETGKASGRNGRKYWTGSNGMPPDTGTPMSGYGICRKASLRREKSHIWKQKQKRIRLKRKKL